MKSFKQYLKENWKVHDRHDETAHHHDATVNGHKVFIRIGQRKDNPEYGDGAFTVNGALSSARSGVKSRKDSMAIMRHVEHHMSSKVKELGIKK